MLTKEHNSVVFSPCAGDWIEAWPLSKDKQTDVCSLLNQTEEGTITKTPRLLLVDDDPIFCQSMVKTAEKKGVELVVCKSIGEVLSLSKEKNFDAVLLDFQFGELTAYQVGHFLTENVPIFLVSNCSRSEVHYRDWPFNIRDFFSKSIGNLAILNHAMSVLSLTYVREVAISSIPSSRFNWKTIASIMTTVLATLAYLYYLNLEKLSVQKGFLWNEFGIQSSYVLNQKGSSPKEESHG